MEKSSILKWLGMVTWVITALAAINTGLLPLEFNVFQSEFMMKMSPHFLRFVHYLIGISGAISFSMFIMVIKSGTCGCGKKIK